MNNRKIVLVVGGIGLVALGLVGWSVFTYDDGPAQDPTIPAEVTPVEVREVQSITAADDLNDVVYAKNKGLYYISSFDENIVYVVGEESSKIEGEIPLDSPNRILLDEARQRLYVASGGKVKEIDTSTFSVMKSVNVGRRPLEMAVDKTGQYLFVVNEFSNDLTIIDKFKFEVVDQIAVGRRPVDIAIDRNNEFAYIANKDDATLTKVSVANRSIVGLITNVGRPVVVEAFPDSDLMLILDQFGDQLLVLDTTTDTIIKRIDVVDYPSAIEFDLENNRLFISSFTQSSIGIVDLDREAMTEVIKLGSAFEPISGLNNMIYNLKLKALVLTNTNTGKVFFVPL